MLGFEPLAGYHLRIALACQLIRPACQGPGSILSACKGSGLILRRGVEKRRELFVLRNIRFDLIHFGYYHKYNEKIITADMQSLIIISLRDIHKIPKS